MKNITRETLYKESKSESALIDDYIKNGGNVTKCPSVNGGQTQQIRCNNAEDRHSKKYQARSRDNA